MNIHNVSFVLSAVSPAQYPPLSIPEVAFAGRSNVGKSSFINKMLNRKKLARTSSTPGKTAQINFYNIDDTMHFVDLPGYGYASVSKTEKAKWQQMIESYLSIRPQLLQTILLVDARHKPTADDLKMADWIRYNHGKLVVFATKADKVKNSELQKNLDVISKTLKIKETDILIKFSAETGAGVPEAWAVICGICELPMVSKID